MLPIPEALMVSFLPAQAEMQSQGIVAGRVSVKLGTARPFVRVTRVAGLPETDSDHPVVSCECWAATEVAAATLAYTILDVMPRIVGAQVRGWAPALGPLSRPDDDGSPRYVVDVELLTYS